MVPFCVFTTSLRLNIGPLAAASAQRHCGKMRTQSAWEALTDRMSAGKSEWPRRAKRIATIAGVFGAVCTLGDLECGRVAYGAPLFTESQWSFARGINLSSGELNPEHNPAVYGKDYIYPPLQELDYYATKGFAVVRLPYRWERLQPTLFGSLDGAELDRIKRFVDAAQARGMRVILSPHNFGRYFLHGSDTLIGTSGVPIEAFADFSRKVAAAFAGNDAIYGLSLMNEPHDSKGLWKQTAQRGLDAIRTVDHERLVLAPGDYWSGAWSWRRYNDDFLLADAADHIMYEAHQYFDLDHTGTYKLGYTLNLGSPQRGIEWVRPFVEWLKLHQLRGIITEFGVPGNDPRWLELTQRLLSYLAQENIPWTYWAGGPWWGKYPLSAEPRDGVDAPIMSVLTKDYRMLRSHPSP
jgi:endoglucanase